MFVPSSHHLRRVVVRPLLPCFGLFLRETDLYRVLYCCELSVTWKGVVGAFSRLRLEEFRVSYLDTVSSRKTRNRLGEHEDESHDVHLRLTCSRDVNVHAASEVRAQVNWEQILLLCSRQDVPPSASLLTFSCSHGVLLRYRTHIAEDPPLV